MVRVTLKPSRQLAIVVTGVHLGAIAALYPLDLALWAKLVIAIPVGISLVTTLCRHALLAGRSALVAVELHELDHAAVRTRDGIWHDARILETTYVSPILSVLNLRIPGRLLPCHILIVPDNVDPEDFRGLRVRLRWGYRKEALRGSRDPAASADVRAAPTSTP